MTERSQYIGGRSGGITTSIFTAESRSKGQYTIQGKSGRSLDVFVTNSVVHISSAEDRKVLFAAHAINNTYNLNIRNIEANGQRHPDLYPGQLAKYSYEFLTENGIPMDVMNGKWVPSYDGKPSVNYEAYASNLSGTINPTVEDKAKAAQNTWTGRLAASLGYTDIHQILEGEGQSGEMVIVQFIKPAPLTLDVELPTLLEANKEIDWSGKSDIVASYTRSL